MTSHRRCGSQITFHSNRDSDSDISIMDSDDENVRQLTDERG